MTPPNPEALAREKIDEALEQAGWAVQNRDEVNLSAGRGVAVREFKMKKGHGFADYLLFVDGQAVGALEAKKEGHTLTGVEGQARKYAQGLPDELDAPVRPLPFLMLSTGVETRLTNRLDPSPRSRPIYAPPRPETLAEWLQADSITKWVHGWTPARPDLVSEPPPPDYGTRPSTLRGRLRAMPPAEIPGLWPNQQKAIANLENSLAHDRPRALIQMATGSGKSLTAVVACYRLIKFGGARRILWLVDRDNLGEQAEDEFASYRTYDDNKKFTELYNVQRLQSNTISSSAKVVITTIQRLFSMLKGEPELAPEAEEGSQFDTAAQPENVEPVGVEYNAAIPPEYFDVVIIDECHRSIYTLWRQVIEYFDAYLIGLTATPAKHTFGFFNKNLVMEYSQDDAVVDGVNVDFDIYRIRTKVTERGATMLKAENPVVGKRDRVTRELRWETPDDDLTYTGQQLDRDVVAKDQIRLIVQTFRERLKTEIVPGREHVPKTLVFAKDDSHAEDIVDAIREEFGKGNDFCQKITYKVTGKKPKQLIQEFRTGYNPRIAVTVDMIATGTDVRPIEIVMFMRTVKSRVLYEQMKGRGGRVAKPDEMQDVTPDARTKDHFVLIDCVGVTEMKQQDTQPLDRQKSVSLAQILEHVGVGGANEELVTSLASRLARLEKRCTADEHKVIQAVSEGATLKGIAHDIIRAVDPDTQATRAREKFELDAEAEPAEEQLQAAAKELIKEAVAPLATNPPLRKAILEVQKQQDQVIDETTQDELTFAGAAPEAKEKAKALVQDFEQYIAEHKDEIEALQFFYSVPHKRRLTYKDIKALAEAIQAPPRRWTPERLWQAYQKLDESKVRGAGGQRLLTDIVSLVRYALHDRDELVPYAEHVRERFDNWLAQQDNKGRKFNEEQLRWLQMIRDHVANSMEVDIDDFDLSPFAQAGGLGKASQVFGKELPVIIRELNEALSA